MQVLLLITVVTVVTPQGGCISVYPGTPITKRHSTRRVVPVSQREDSKRTLHVKKTDVGVWVWVRSYTTCVRKISVTTTTVTRTTRYTRGSLTLGYALGLGIAGTGGIIAGVGDLENAGVAFALIGLPGLIYTGYVVAQHIRSRDTVDRGQSTRDTLKSSYCRPRRLFKVEIEGSGFVDRPGRRRPTRSGAVFFRYPSPAQIAQLELAGQPVPTTAVFSHRRIKQTIDLSGEQAVLALRKKARVISWRGLAMCLARRAKAPRTRCNEEAYFRYPIKEWEQRLHVLVADRRPDVVRGAVLFGLNSGVSEIRAAVCKKVHRGMLASSPQLRDLIRAAARHPDPYTRLECAAALQGVASRRTP